MTLRRLYIRMCYVIRMLQYDIFFGKRDGLIALGARIRHDPDMTLHLGKGVWLGGNGHFQGKGCVKIGASTYIGAFFSINCIKQITVGENCLFGNFVSIIDNNHGMKLGLPMGQQELNSKSVIIGDDCWIGEKATILAGVQIGHGSVIGAGSVVRMDVPAMTIVAGVPARQIRLRTDSHNPNV